VSHGHGHGHSHRAAKDADDAVHVNAAPKWILLGVLGLALVATVVGIVAWWPSHGVVTDRAALERASISYAAPGVTFPRGTVTAITPACPASGSTSSGSGSSGAPTCGTITVDLGGGQHETVSVPPEVSGSSLSEGDKVELTRTPGSGANPTTYAYFTILRGGSLLWLAVLFAVVVIAVARWRGLFAIVGLAFGGAVIWWFLLPALYDGSPGIPVALVSAAAIMFVVLYMTHGISLRTSTALAGTLLGVGLTAAIGTVTAVGANLTGIADEAGSTLQILRPETDFRSLLGAAVVIAGLGVLNDVTITQASAVWELRAATPDASRRRVFASAMRIGRDHIASTIYTIVFAYVGTAVIGLMLLQIYDRPLLDLVSNEQLAEEIVRTLASAIGLVLAVPVTTAVAAVLASPGHKPARPTGRRVAGRVDPQIDGAVQAS